MLNSEYQPKTGKWGTGVDSGGNVGSPLVNKASIRSCKDVSHLIGSPNSTMASILGKNGSNPHGAAVKWAVDILRYLIKPATLDYFNNYKDFLPCLRSWSTASRVGNACL